MGIPWRYSTRNNVRSAYAINNDSTTLAQRKLCAHYNIRHKNKVLSIQSIKKWTFEETGPTIDKPRSGRPNTSRNSTNIERVRVSTGPAS